MIPLDKYIGNEIGCFVVQIMGVGIVVGATIIFSIWMLMRYLA